MGDADERYALAGLIARFSPTSGSSRLQLQQIDEHVGHCDFRSLGDAIRSARAIGRGSSPTVMEGVARFQSLATARCNDAAFEHLGMAFAERDNWLLWFGTEPKLDALRDDPRFWKLFRTMNNPLAALR